MKEKLSQLGEFGLIDLIRKNVPLTKETVKGIGDDAAVLNFSKSKNDYELFTTDMMVEDVHFTRRMKPSSIGHKALACNISDIAAMGGRPRAAVISLGVPPDLRSSVVQEIYSGISRLAEKFQVSIVGGDTVYSKKIIINVALLGLVKKSELVLRDGAAPEDMIFVTGALGRSFPTGKHLSFLPRVKESQFLVKHFHPTAMIDISDGLAADLFHILNSSRVGACLYEEKIPRAKNASLNEALSDGEDFELLFTLPKKEGERLLRMKQKAFHFYHIGEINQFSKRLVMIKKDKSQENLSARGFTHF